MAQPIKQQSVQYSQEGINPFWKRVISLPACAVVYDISTGEKYRIEQFAPSFSDEAQSKCEYFNIKGTGKEEKDLSNGRTWIVFKQVYAKHIRQIGETYKTAI